MMHNKLKIATLVAVAFSLSVTVANAQNKQDSPNLLTRISDPASEAGLLRRIAGKCAWRDFMESSEEAGVEVILSATSVYQLNTRKGTMPGATSTRAGRFTGTYDLEVNLDLAKIAGLKGAEIRILAEGGFGSGIGATSVGSIMDPNAAAYSDHAIAITEFYYHQSLFDGRVKFRIGKFDITGGYSCRHCDVAFDTNSYANDETAQFLNSALVNNPTIPFPDKGLGASIYAMPVDGWYLAAGVADTGAVATQTGFNTAFKKGASAIYLFETGITPMIGKLGGAYRVGFWLDTTDKERFTNGKIKNRDMGIYASFDQMLYRENPSVEDDSQGLGAFFRAGFADPNVNDIHKFFSAGVSYQGLIPGRDEDTFAVGYAYSKAGYNPEFTAKNEQLWEVYYSAQLTPYLAVTPNFQYIKNPGMGEVRDTTVWGVRVQLTF